MYMIVDVGAVEKLGSRPGTAYKTVWAFLLSKHVFAEFNKRRICRF
jgi:hypothetical protein